ncbi:MAG: hypothetical protein Q9174_003162 [Haloplaca sp. 1 TL-2023]
MRYIGFHGQLSASSLIFAAALLVDTAVAVHATHHAFLKRQGCSNIERECGGDSPTRCIDYVCSSCREVDSSVPRCCRLTGNIAIASCIDDALSSTTSSSDDSSSDDGGDGDDTNDFDSDSDSSSSDTSPSTTGDVPFTITSASPSQASVQSVLSYGPCSSLESAVESCSIKSSDFFDGVFTDQASCLCYVSGSFRPSVFDDYYGSCLGYVETAAPELYSDIQLGEERDISTPCAFVGDVIATTTARDSDDNDFVIGGAAGPTPSPGNGVTTTVVEAAPTSGAQDDGDSSESQPQQFEDSLASGRPKVRMTSALVTLAAVMAIVYLV